MPSRARQINVLFTCLAVFLAVVAVSVLIPGSTSAYQQDSAYSPPSPKLFQPLWTTLDFESVGDMNPVGTQGLASFSWVWRGAVDRPEAEVTGRELWYVRG